MNKKKALLVAGLAAAYVYSTGGDELLKQLAAPPTDAEVISTEGMPFWQFALINLAASIGFDALGAAAKRAWVATQKKAAAKAGEAVAEKVGLEAGEAVAEKVGLEAGEAVAEKVGLEAGEAAAEKVGAKVATEVAEVGEDVAKALAKLESEGVKAVTEAVEKAAVAAADDVAIAGLKAGEAAGDKVAAKAGEAVGEKVAATVGEDVAEKVAAAVAMTAAERAGEKAAAKAATLAARATATATKIATMTARAAAMGPLGALDLLISGIVVTLQNTVKELEPEYYEPVPAGLWSYDQLPDAAKAVISAIPIAGSLLDLVGPLFQFGEKCPEGTHRESPGGLCFPDCPAGYKADGAFICYKQYDGFDQNGGNGELHTLTSITKHILLDTGTIPTDCGPDHDNDAGICYPKCRAGFHGVGPLCWQDTVTLGVGTAVDLEDCPAGFRNDGLTCQKDLACWGGGCSTHCDTTWNDNDGGFCHTHCDPISCNDGPKTIGRLDNGGTCPADKERIDGLCYDRCPDGYYHAPGMPYVCKKNGEPDNYDRGGSMLPGCGDKENISGLCYGKVPEGYTRKVVGTLDQNCPEGSTDFGVGCSRESKTREGKLGFVAELRALRPDE